MPCEFSNFKVGLLLFACFLERMEAQSEKNQKKVAKTN